MSRSTQATRFVSSVARDLSLLCKSKHNQNVEDRVYPDKDDLDKDDLESEDGVQAKKSDEDGNWVEHYARKKKYGVPLSTTGKPPVSREQAIAIGLSVKERGGPKAKDGGKEKPWTEKKWDRVKDKRKAGKEVSSSGRKKPEKRVKKALGEEFDGFTILVALVEKKE